MPLLSILLAAVPPALVVLDRWLSSAEPLVAALRPTWCSIDVLCRTAFPPYFLIIFALTGLVILLVVFVAYPPAPQALEPAPYLATAPDEIFLTKPSPTKISRALQAAAAVGYLLSASIALTTRQFSPGVYVLIIAAYLVGQVLENLRLRDVLARIRRNSAVIVLIISSHLSLVLFLSWHQRRLPAEWGAGLIFLACAFGLIRIRRQVSPIVWIVLAAMVLFSIRIGSWQLAIVGDEYRFFLDAKDILSPLRAERVLIHLFDGTWTYGAHPYVSSLIQAVFMFFLGRDNFGWRFSNVYLSAVSIGLFYLFFRSFFSKRVALLAALLMAFSHFLMNFSKIGYNNLQALFVMALVLWLAGVATRSGRPIAYTALGVACSACFYVFPGALYVLALPVILIGIYPPQERADALGKVGLALAAFIILVFPLIVQPDFWESKLPGTFLNSRELVNGSTPLWFHFGSNLLYSLTSYLYIPNESHFVVSSYVDPLTAVFVPIGLAISLGQVRRNRSALVLLLAFVVEAILVGTTHDRPFPTATRMFLMLPWFFLLAALGIDYGLTSMARLFSGPYAIPTIAATLMVAILGLNIYQSTRVFRQRTAGIAGLEMLFLRMLQHDAKEDPGTLKDYLFITTPDWGIDGLLVLQDVYKLPPSPTQLHRVVAERPTLPQEALPLISQPDTVVIIQPWMDETVRVGLQVQLAGLGRRPCDVRDIPEKDVRFTFWFTPALEGLCQRANTDW